RLLEMNDGSHDGGNDGDAADDPSNEEAATWSRPVPDIDGRAKARRRHPDGLSLGDATGCIGSAKPLGVAATLVGGRRRVVHIRRTPTETVGHTASWIVQRSLSPLHARRSRTSSPPHR